MAAPLQQGAPFPEAVGLTAGNAPAGTPLCSKHGGGPPEGYEGLGPSSSGYV